MNLSDEITRNAVSGIAVDFGGSKIAAARITDGQVIEQQRVRTESRSGADAQIATIIELVEALAPARDEILAVAVTGRVDQAGCWHAVNQSTLASIDAVPLKQQLDTHFNRSCTVLNDAIAAATAEACLTDAGRDENFAYITVSTGVGGACVVQGRVLGSVDGMAGHLGFMTTRLGTSQCGSGRMGTVESVASGRAIEKRALLAGHGQIDAKSVFEHHYQGERWASDIINESATAIAELAANLVAAVGVRKVVLGGSIGLANDYQGMVEQALANEPQLFRCDVECSRFGHSGVLLGALVAGALLGQPQNSHRTSHYN